MKRDILDHYSDGVEQRRLRQGSGDIEFRRTQEIMKRFLPRSPSRILDVGGGPGAYSAWLARLGHRVYLIDPVPLHVKQATSISKKMGDTPFSAKLGDARSLDAPDNAYDVVLLMGPLYHLTQKSERLAALRQCRRVLRPGGLLFAAGIGRYASLIDGLRYKFLKDPAFRKIMRRDLKTGQHRNQTSNLEHFTTSFFHRPKELAMEIEQADLKLKRLYAVEGPASMLTKHDLNTMLKNKETAPHLLRALASVEEEPSLLGISAHMLAVVTKT